MRDAVTLQILYVTFDNDKKKLMPWCFPNFWLKNPVNPNCPMIWRTLRRRLWRFGYLWHTYIQIHDNDIEHNHLHHTFSFVPKLSQAPSLPQKKPLLATFKQPSPTKDRTPSSISNQASLASAQHLPLITTNHREKNAFFLWKNLPDGHRLERAGALPHLSKWRRQPWLWANMLRSVVGHLHSRWQNVVTSPASPNFCQVALS